VKLPRDLEVLECLSKLAKKVTLYVKKSKEDEIIRDFPVNYHSLTESLTVYKHKRMK
jgi:hypothetical protein